MGASRNPARQGLLKLMLRLPLRRGDLQRMWDNDASFIALCEAYHEATTTLERLQLHPVPAEAGLVDEYRALCLDLEQDVERHWRVPHEHSRSEPPLKPNR